MVLSFSREPIRLPLRTTVSEYIEAHFYIEVKIIKISYTARMDTQKNWHLDESRIGKHFIFHVGIF